MRPGDIDPRNQGGERDKWRRAEPPVTTCQQVWFESGPLEEKRTMRVDVHVDGKQDLRMTRNTGLATSTPANSDQNWVPSKEFRGVSTIKVTRPAPVAREQGLPLG